MKRRLYKKNNNVLPTIIQCDCKKFIPNDMFSGLLVFGMKMLDISERSEDVMKEVLIMRGGTGHLLASYPGS